MLRKGTAFLSFLMKSLNNDNVVDVDIPGEIPVVTSSSEWEISFHSAFFPFPRLPEETGGAAVDAISWGTDLFLILTI